jgi:hypothetical protein
MSSNQMVDGTLKYLNMMQIWCSVVAAVLVAGSAQAAPFVPVIDFRDSAFEPPSGADVYSHTAGGIDFTFESLSLSGAPLIVAGGELYWDSNDGFGVKELSYEDDEVEFPEAMRISFGETVLVERFLISDLFIEHGYTEQGFYSLDDGANWVAFFANGLHGNGEVELNLGGINISEILFTAPGVVGSQKHEFSVAGVDAFVIKDEGGVGGTPAPEPSAAMVFGAGLLLFGRRCTRRKH